MKRRICTILSPASASNSLLTNNGKIDKEFGEDAIANYFKEWKGFDFQIDDNKLMIGVEPTYMYDKMKIITIHKDKEKSDITTGYAVGAWASTVLKKTKTYKSYKYKSKFTKFVDKWHGDTFNTTAKKES